jgi:hypothetical protein
MEKCKGVYFCFIFPQNIVNIFKNCWLDHGSRTTIFMAADMSKMIKQNER